jgi:hypothetical protein
MTSPKPLSDAALEEAAVKDLVENLPERFVEYLPRAELLAEEISKASRAPGQAGLPRAGFGAASPTLAPTQLARVRGA